MFTEKDIQKNKYYVGADSVFPRNWGHPTETAAIKHAQEILNNQNKDEIFIVKIVKVVRRKAAPIEVKNVK